MKLLLLATAYALLSQSDSASLTETTPVQGQCATFTAFDEACSGATHGSFNAKAVNLESVKSCAQYAKETCGDKAAYVSFHPGEANYMSESGDCMWAASDACSCADAGSCHTNSALVTQYQTESIAKALASTTESSTDIAPVVSTGDAHTVASVTDDPNYIKAQAENVLTDAEPPESLGVRTIPSASEVDDSNLREDPAKVMAEAMGVAEREHGCPESRAAQMHRGEWQCVSKGEHSSKVLGGIVGGSIGVVVLMTLFLHGYGVKVRGKGADDEAGEEEEAAAEEEEDE